MDGRHIAVLALVPLVVATALYSGITSNSGIISPCQGVPLSGCASTSGGVAGTTSISSTATSTSVRTSSTTASSSLQSISSSSSSESSSSSTSSVVTSSSSTSSSSSWTTTTSTSTSTSSSTSSTSTSTSTSSTTTSSTTSSTSSTSTSSGKQSLAYLAGVNYDQAVESYSKQGGFTALGPQVYALDANGNVFLADSSFDPSSFVSLAHAAHLQVIPLVMAGSGLCSGQVWCNDTDILAIIDHPSQLSAFEQQLVSLCKTYDYDGIQLDWETTLNSTYMNTMTAALNSIANSVHAMSSRRSLSLTTYYWDYAGGPYNTWALSQGSIDQLNLQGYTSNFSAFENEVAAMIRGMANDSKLAVGFGDYGGVNPPIAGFCMQYLLSSGVNAVAIWPAWGTDVSLGSYGYSDTIYGTSSYYQLFQIFLNS